ncbi:DUF6228 family protein [Streptomyces atratus]|uniref:DUF6228 family protein n=1 Tax=Streptomyces atratus TaxID=1893 RepID=UPI0033FB1323
MTSLDDGTDVRSRVTIRCQSNASIGVTFCDRFTFDADAVHYAVELWAPGLTARVNEVVAWIWDSDLAPFLEELAADFRGWDGERSWQTNDRDLAVSAVFRSSGHVGLTWTRGAGSPAQAASCTGRAPGSRLAAATAVRTDPP